MKRRSFFTRLLAPLAALIPISAPAKTRRVIVRDRNGVPITPGCGVRIFCTEEKNQRIGNVVEVFADLPTVNDEGYWVDVREYGGVSGQPSYILEVVGALWSDEDLRISYVASKWSEILLLHEQSADILEPIFAK